jgi:hypothetical protein
MRVVIFASFFAAALSGCSGIPSVPYEDPAQTENLARVRIITNSDAFGDSVIGSCAPAIRHEMARAGRFWGEGQPSINYPQQPLNPKKIGMAGRVAPDLTDYVPATRMAEGVYKEIVTEYRVRADLPFQLATRGATFGNNGRSFSSCPGQALIYHLEPGKDYEALIGLRYSSNANGAPAPTCVFGIVELVPLPGTKIVMPKRMEPDAPPQTLCKK